MKKLMIAAAAAAMVCGASAECGDPVIINNPTGAQVYKVSFSGKTTIGIPLKDVTVANLCGDPDVTPGCVVRVPGTLKIEGWIALCDPACATILDTFNAPSYQAWWQTKPYTADIPDGNIAWDVINIIGKKATDAEAAGKFTGTVTYSAANNVTWAIADLQFAGFGKSVNKHGTWNYFNSFSGDFANAPVASWYIKGNVCDPTHVYDPCTLTVDCQEAPNTVAFGKWAMKYDSAASKKLTKDTTLPKTPSYATIQAS